MAKAAARRRARRARPGGGRPRLLMRRWRRRIAASRSRCPARHAHFLSGKQPSTAVRDRVTGSKFRGARCRRAGAVLPGRARVVFLLVGPARHESNTYGAHGAARGREGPGREFSARRIRGWAWMAPRAAYREISAKHPESSSRHGWGRVDESATGVICARRSHPHESG